MHFCSIFGILNFIRPNFLSLLSCFALLAGKERTRLQTRFPFLSVCISKFFSAKHLCSDFGFKLLQRTLNISEACKY